MDIHLSAILVLIPVNLNFCGSLKIVLIVCEFNNELPITHWNPKYKTVIYPKSVHKLFIWIINSIKHKNAKDVESKKQFLGVRKKITIKVGVKQLQLCVPIKFKIVALFLQFNWTNNSLFI